MCVGWTIILPKQRTCLVVMGIKLHMISSDVNAVIAPTVSLGYTLLPGRGRSGKIKTKLYKYTFMHHMCYANTLSTNLFL